MKKVGIVTITCGANYGNRLQNYAMQTALDKLGYSPFTIRKADEKKTLLSRMKKCIKHITRYKYTALDKRMEQFEQFNSNYIKFSNSYIQSDDYSKKICEEFDAFICGSDQIWNPKYKMNTGSHFLSFVNGKRKISVSASLGVEKLNESEVKRISNWLKKLDAISVREKAAKKICEDITGREVSVLIDPTLMLTSEEWRNIAKKPKNIKPDNYILCYLLGKTDKKIINKLKGYAEEKGRKIVFLEDFWRNLNVSSDEEFAYGPSEFIWLIDNAYKVVTDSFHAMVFSIIFKKEFLIVTRHESNNNMNSRFVSLIELLNVKDTIYSKQSGFEQYAKIDYKEAESILKKEKNSFNQFIKNNLEIEHH